MESPEYAAKDRPEIAIETDNIEEHQVDATTRGVFLSDDFGVVYCILQMENY